MNAQASTPPEALPSPTGTSLNVLLIEDSDSDAKMVLRFLRKAGYAESALRVETADGLHAALAGQQWDLVIADFTLPQFDAPTALAIVRKADPDIPFLVVSGTIGEDSAVGMMKAGANDYLMKSNLSRLAPAVDRELREAQTRRDSRRAGEALRDSEAQYRAVAETAVDAIITTNQEGCIVDCNRGAQKMFGYDRLELIGQPIHLVIPGRIGDWDPSPARPVTSGRASPVGRTMENQGLRKDGAVFPLELSFAGWETAKGNFYTSIIRDITERVREQKQIHRQLDQLTALRSIDSAITSSFDVHLVLSLILEQAMAQLGVHAADVLVIDSHSLRLGVAASRGLTGSTHPAITPRLADGPAGQSIQEQRTVVADAAEFSSGDSERAAWFVQEGFLTYIGSPLLVKGQVKGVLELFHRSPIQPDGEWRAFLESLAGQAAIALENITMFHELQRSNATIALAYDITLEGWSRALDLRDKETEGHSMRVTEMSIRLAQEMGFGEEELSHFRRGAILHDVGKLGIPDSILLKPGPLTDEETAIMRKHPLYSYEWLSPIAYLRPALDIPYCHHEHWDGSGYPRGLREATIPLAARIFAVIDVWDALRSDRPYRPAWAEDETRDYIRAQSGKLFDPAVVEIFLERLSYITRGQ